MSFRPESPQCCRLSSISGLVLGGICSVLGIAIVVVTLLPASGSSVFAAKLIQDEAETPEPREPMLAAASGDGIAAIDLMDFKGLKLSLIHI